MEQRASGGISKRSAPCAGLLAGAGVAGAAVLSTGLAGPAQASTPEPQQGRGMVRILQHYVLGHGQHRQSLRHAGCICIARDRVATTTVSTAISRAQPMTPTRRRTGAGAAIAWGCSGARRGTSIARENQFGAGRHVQGPPGTSYDLYFGTETGTKAIRSRTGAGAAVAVRCTGKGHRASSLVTARPAARTRQGAAPTTA